MATLEERLYGIGNIVAAGVGAYQAYNIHQANQKNEDELHAEEMRLLQEQHKKELFTAKQTYLLSTFTDLEQYCQELNENLLSSSRDAERDMVDQRNQQFQTILLASTIMLTALICVLIQGVLPPSSSFFVLSYSLSNSFSLVCLSLTILLCIEITFRVSKFMYNKSKTNIEHLSEAMLHTSEVMKNIRGDSWLAGQRAISPTNGTDNTKQQDVEETKAPAPSPVGPGSFTRQYTMAAHELLPHKQHHHRASTGEGGGSPVKQDSKRAAALLELNNNDEAPYEGVTKMDTSSSRRPPLVKSRSASSALSSLLSPLRPSLAGHRQKTAASFATVTSHSTTVSRRGGGGERGKTNIYYEATANNRENYYENLKNREPIASLKPESLDLEWAVHEQQIQEYFQTRDKINEKMELLAVANDILDGNDQGVAGDKYGKRVSFELFWKENCSFLSNVALVLFYLGTSTMLLATMVFMYLQFAVTYKNSTAGLCGISTIGMSLVVCLILALYLRYFDHALILMREQMESEAVDEKRGIMYRLQQLLSQILSRKWSTARGSYGSTESVGTGTLSNPLPATVGPPAGGAEGGVGGGGLTLDTAAINRETDEANSISSYAALNHFNEEIRISNVDRTKKSK